MLRVFFICLVIAGIVISCGGNEQKVTNPNGMSEMSQIMEDWYNQLETYAKQLKSGKKIETFVTLDQQKIYTAEVSKEKDNVHGEQFDGFTDSFFYNYNSVSTAPTYEEQVKAFNLTVKACINCHEQHCQGPIVRIKKLTVTE